MKKDTWVLNNYESNTLVLHWLCKVLHERKIKFYFVYVTLSFSVLATEAEQYIIWVVSDCHFFTTVITFSDGLDNAPSKHTHTSGPKVSYQM